MKKRISIEVQSVAIPLSDVKEEALLDDTSPATSKPFPDVEKEAMSIFLYEMKSVCKICDVDFQELLETKADVAPDSQEGEVDLELTNPLSNMRNESSMDYSLHDIFTPERMSDFIEGEYQVWATGAHRHVFCSWMYLPEWHRKLESLAKKC